MTKEEFAQYLDGRIEDSILTPDDVLDASDFDLVVVYGASDDLIEFEGAICDELGAYGGGTFFYDKDFESFVDVDDSFEGFDLTDSKKIIALWGKGTELYGNVDWTFDSNIPHATFRIMSRDGVDVFCVGMVMSVTDLK